MKCKCEETLLKIGIPEFKSVSFRIYTIIIAGPIDSFKIRRSDKNLCPTGAFIESACPCIHKIHVSLLENPLSICMRSHFFPVPPD